MNCLSDLEHNSFKTSWPFIQIKLTHLQKHLGGGMKRDPESSAHVDMETPTPRPHQNIHPCSYTNVRNKDQPASEFSAWAVIVLLLCKSLVKSCLCVFSLYAIVT